MFPYKILSNLFIPIPNINIVKIVNTVILLQIFAFMMGARQILLFYKGWEVTRAGTRLFKNRRLIEYLKEATRSARLGTRSVLGAAGKVEI